MKSATATKFTCCDEQQHDNDVSDAQKINKPNTNNMLISMGDHDITYVPITIEQNMPIQSVVNLTSQIQDIYP